MKKSLEDIDKEIISLINKRTLLFTEELKKSGNSSDLFSPVYRTAVSDLIDASDGPVSGDLLKKIFNELLSYSIKLVKPVEVAYLGPEGTFSYLALIETFGSSVTALPQNSIQAVFEEVESGRAAFGIVPVENTTEGSVTYTLDELVETDLKIYSEHLLKISNSLLSKASEIKKIKKVYSHPQPLAQCKNWLNRNLVDVEIVPVASTVKAAEIASTEDFSAAIASESASKIYNLNILASDIEDSRRNFTKFFVLGNMENRKTGRDKTSLVCSIKDEPGSLYRMLKPFSDAGISLSKIESRPNKKELWAYNFFIDLIGHKEDTNVKEAFSKLKEDALFVKILGSYPMN